MVAMNSRQLVGRHTHKSVAIIVIFLTSILTIPCIGKMIYLYMFRMRLTISANLKHQKDSHHVCSHIMRQVKLACYSDWNDL